MLNGSYTNVNGYGIVTSVVENVNRYGIVTSVVENVLL